MDNEIEIKKQKLLKYHLMFGTGNKEKDSLYVNMGYTLIYKSTHGIIWPTRCVYSRRYRLSKKDIEKLTITVKENGGLYFSLKGNIQYPNKEVIL